MKKISARNILEGTVKEVKKGTTTAHVLIDVGGQTVTASITNEAVDDLGLKVGQKVKAIIKSSEVMVGVDRFRSNGKIQSAFLMRPRCAGA